MPSPSYVPVIATGRDVTFKNLTVTEDALVNGELNVTPGSVINLGADTNLYRIGADELATDDSLTVFGDVRIGGNLGVGNSTAATTLGTVTAKIEIFDAAGASLGFLPVYDAIT